MKIISSKFLNRIYTCRFCCLKFQLDIDDLPLIERKRKQDCEGKDTYISCWCCKGLVLLEEYHPEIKIIGCEYKKAYYELLGEEVKEIKND